jgi:hypothetical protein
MTNCVPCRFKFYVNPKSFQEVYELYEKHGLKDYRPTGRSFHLRNDLVPVDYSEERVVYDDFTRYLVRIPWEVRELSLELKNNACGVLFICGCCLNSGVDETSRPDLSVMAVMRCLLDTDESRAYVDVTKHP